MQSELEKAARDFMELFVNDNGSQPGLALDGIDPIDLTDRYVALEAALSAAEPSVADEPIGEVIPYRGPMCQLTNYRELKLRVPVGSLEVGTKLFAHPPALTAQVQDVAEDPDVLWTCHNNMSNMFFGPGATENENEVVWDFAAQSWANANIKLTVSPAPAKQEGKP